MKETRFTAIKQLLTTHKITDQHQLVHLLEEHFAIITNQAAVSRDLRKLKVVKKEMLGELVYTLPTSNVTEEILQLAIIDIQYNEAMIVIKTESALADFVGDYIDQCSDLELLGCLSGENTVFVTPITISKIHATYLALCKRLKFKMKDL